MTWNYNIDEAPKGESVTNTDARGKPYTIFKAHPCLISTKCEKVFISHRLKDGRWNGLAKNEDPIAWQPKPAPAAITLIKE